MKQTVESTLLFNTNTENRKREKQLFLTLLQNGSLFVNFFTALHSCFLTTHFFNKMINILLCIISKGKEVVVRSIFKTNVRKECVRVSRTFKKQRKYMEAKWAMHKISELNMHLAKLNKVLSFLNKMKQLYKLNVIFAVNLET